MKQITIEYTPLWRLKLKFRRSCPERWDEVTPRQLIAITMAYQQNITDNRMLADVFNINRFIANRLDNFHVFKLLEQLNFISDFKPINTFILKNINGCVPPKPRLANMSFGQFIFSDTYFSDYARTQNTDVLNKFVAALYLPPKEQFNEETIEKRAAAMASVSKITKEAVAINYRLVSEWLTDAYPIVFVKPLAPEPGTRNPEPETKSNKQPGNWIKVFDSIVGDDVVNSDKYAKMPVHTVFRFLTRKIKEDIKEKK